MKKVIFLAHFLLAIAGTMCGQTIVSGEYFFDKDPGQGKGAGFPVQSVDSIENQINIPTTGLSEGIHHLGIRFQNVFGVWSQTQARMFLSRKFAPAQTEIVAAEYFFDKDPGIGKGTALTLPVHGDSLYIKTILTNPFDTGAHTLYIRTRNASGEWSLFEGYPFNICSGYGAESEFFYHVEGRKVIFDNQSLYYSSFRWEFGDNAIDSTKINPTHFYTKGVYEANLITHNYCGTDTSKKEIKISGIQSISPKVSANFGNVRIHIKGAGFTNNMEIYLINKDLSIIAAEKVTTISDNLILGNFILSDRITGFYDLIVTDNINFYDTLKSALLLTNYSTKNDYSVTLNGPTRIRLNQATNFNVSIRSNNDNIIFGIPVMIGIELKETESADILIQNPFYKDQAYDSLPAYLDSFPQHIITLYNPQNGKYIKFCPIMIPYTEPQSTFFINFLVRGNKLDTIRLIVSSGEGVDSTTIFNSGLGFSNDGGSSKNSCQFLSPYERCMTDLFQFIPGVGCLTSSFSFGCAISNLNNEKTLKKLIDMSQQGTLMAVQCTPAALLKWVSTAKKVATYVATRTGLITNILKDVVTKDECNPKSEINRAYDREIAIYQSYDPNDKTGNMGHDEKNYINGKTELIYKVSFENIKSAIIPAGQVSITDYLDTAIFDFTSFKVLSAGVGDTVFNFGNVENDSMIFDFDMQPIKNIILRQKIYTNLDSGKIDWRFISLDTTSYNLTDNIDDGFLPPNITPPEGEGFVLFSIKPKSDLPHGTVIKNKADIIFDFNDPITTPEWINTIDKVKPESYIEILPDTLYSDTITLRMHGSDDGSGVQSYDIFLSVNDSAYTPYYQGLTGDSLRFAGNYNNTYRFFSRARDFVGNLEDTTHTADAQTRLLVSAGWINNSDSRVHFSPNPVRYTLYADINLPGGNVCMARLYNIFGHEVLRRDLPNRAISALDVSGLPEGLYFIEISRQGELRGLSKVIVIIK